MKTLRPIQSQKANEAYLIFSSYNCVYIAGEVRSGKTSTALEVCRLHGAKKVLILTKKNAIGFYKSDSEDGHKGIIGDYMCFRFNKYFELDVINDESMHKIEDPESYDIVIHDEHHRFGGFPKPGKYTKMFKEMFFGKPMIFLSGTPQPEDSSQMYHQLWVAGGLMWSMYSNFYKWAKDYVNIKQKRLGTHIINDYANGITKKIMNDVSKYMVTMTKEESGFKSKVEEEILYVDVTDMTKSLCKRLMDDRVIEGKDETILADTPAKLQQKLHQLWSGTIKFDSGNRKVLDYSKIDFIIDRFGDSKVAIFYKFIAELTAIKDRLGDRLTTDIEEFSTNKDKWIALQVVSGREGTNLSAADYLVMYNIDFSATSYWQARDRMTVASRTENKVYWIFANGGIEDSVYKAVSKKKSYTQLIFKKEFKIK